MSGSDDGKDRLWQRARELARSGKFPTWIGIEWELRFTERFPEARAMLKNPLIRAELDALCDAARMLTNDRRET